MSCAIIIVMPLDLLTIGDSAIDLYMRISDTELDPYQGKVCFFHGTKIMVNSFESAVAGNAVNVALGCAKLGVKTGIYTELGNDQNAKLVIQILKNGRVGIKTVVINKGKMTNVHPIIVFGTDRTIFSYHEKFNYKITKWPQTKWIYYTSLAENFPEFQAKLIEHVKRTGTGLAMNPGTVHMKAGIDKLKNVFSITDILIVNREEAIKLTELHYDSNVSEIHNHLHKLGPKLTVITDGKNGATAKDVTGKFEQRQIYEIAHKPVDNKTGAGDAFSAGFMSAIIHGKSMKEALKWGTINSSYAIREVGANKGLLSLKEIEKL